MIPRDQIADIVKTASGAQSVIWQAEALPFEPDNYVELAVLADVPMGRDEYRQSFDEERDAVAYTAVGWRKITLTAKAYSYDARCPAFEILEKLRRRLRMPTASNALLALNVSVASFAASVQLPTTQDNREVSVHSMDIIVFFVETETDYSNDGSYIKEVNTGDSVPGTTLN